MKIVIVIQARMNSTRLPGKVMLPLGDKPLLVRVVERIRRVKGSDVIVVATTNNAIDDCIVDLCGRINVYCYRGSENDVLARYAEVALIHNADVIVRITSDCPLIDPALVERAISIYQEGGCDYLSNMLPPTWPMGMAVEVFSAKALYEAHAEASRLDEREHVTPFIYWRPERYRLRNIENVVDLSFHRWTVDTLEDYELVSRLFCAVHSVTPGYSLSDLLAAMDSNPQWIGINQHIQQNKLLLSK